MAEKVPADGDRLLAVPIDTSYNSLLSQKKGARAIAGRENLRMRILARVRVRKGYNCFFKCGYNCFFKCVTIVFENWVTIVFEITIVIVASYNCFLCYNCF